MADWSDALSKEDIPSIYNLFIGDTVIKAEFLYNIMYKDSTSAEPYEIIAYNEPNDVVISGNDAVISGQRKIYVDKTSKSCTFVA